MVDVTSHLRQSGFNDDEIAAWATTTRQNLTAAGFNDEEVDDYLGAPKTPKTVPPAFLDRLQAGKALTDFYSKIAAAVPDAKRVFGEMHPVAAKMPGAVAGGFNEGFGAEPLGINEEELYKTLGIPAPTGGAIVTGMPGLNALRSGAAALDVMMRATNGTIRAVAEAAGVIGEGVGQEQGMNERMKRDINSLGQIAVILAGTMHPTSPASQVRMRGPGGAPEAAPIGGLPKGEDFSTAGTVIGHGDTTPAMEAKLADLYESKGLHPAEVAHDAQTDVTITQSLLSVDKQDMPAAYVTAYHGSPHDFDAFSTERIGTGEGAQSYGHGLYFAENEGVARSYRDTLSPKAQGMVSDLVNDAGGDWKIAASRFEENLRGREDLAKKVGGTFKHHAEDVAVLDALKKGEPGGLYQVRIHADPERMLDWDKPINQQSDFIRSKLGDRPETGAQYYEKMTAGQKGSEIDFSNAHSNMGIPGIKYLDQGSRITDPPAEPLAKLLDNKNEMEQIRFRQERGEATKPMLDRYDELRADNDRIHDQIEAHKKAQETRNFVVFNDKDVEITHKNGEPVTGPERAQAMDILNERQPSSAGAAAVKPPAYSDAQAQVLSKISIDEKSPTAKLTWDKLYTNTMDKLFPIAKAVKASGETLAAEENPYQLARLLAGSAGKADHFLNNGTFDFHTYENNGASLKEILAPIKDDLNGFRAYMASARALELEGRGIKSGFDAGEAPSAPPLISAGLDAPRTVVVEGREKFAKPMLELVDYQNRVAAYARDAGVISADGYKAMMQINQLYVPFSRVMGLDEGAHIRGGGSSLQARNPVKAIKGSARDIIDPLESIIRNTHLMVEMAERNVVGTKLVDMLKRMEGEMPELPRATGEAGIPPVKEGYVRFYHGGDEPTTGGGRWVTTDPEYARNFRSNGNPKDVHYVDVPKGHPSEVAARARDAMDEQPGFETNAVGTYRHIELPEELAKQMKPLFPQKETPRAKAMADEFGAVGVKNADELAAALDHATAPLKEGEIAILRDGKRETYQVDPDLAKVMKGLDAQAMGMFERVLAYPASLLRAGAVLTPQFWARHIMRDYLYATATSTPERGLFTPWDMAKGLAGLIVKDADYWNWLKSGGANVATASMDRQYLQENLRKLTGETGLVGRSWNVLADPEASMWQKTAAVGTLPFKAIEKFVVDPLRAGTQIAEEASHLAAFKKGMRASEAAEEAPGNLRDQIIRAGWASRDTAVDAARMGASMRAYNQIISFGNIKLQDTDRVVRAFKDNPITATALITGAITVPAVILWSLNHDDPDYQELPQWEKDFFFVVPVGTAAPSPLHEAQAQERGEPVKPSAAMFLRLPKPWAMGMIFGSGVERMLEMYKGHNPEPFREFGKHIWETSGPDFVPTAAAPIINQFANRSTFTNRTLIPAAQEKFLPEYQYTPYTTELTKQLGQTIGAFPGISQLKMDNSGWGGTAKAITSPILMENYVRGWTGTLGMYALQAADKGLRAAGVLPDAPKPTSTLADIPVIQAFVVRYPSATTESVQKFQDDYEQAQKFMTTWQAMAKDGNVAAMKHIQEMADTHMLEQLDSFHDAIGVLNQTVRLVYKNPDIPADEKRQLIDSMYYGIIQTAQGGEKAIHAIREKAADVVSKQH